MTESKELSNLEKEGIEAGVAGEKLPTCSQYLVIALHGYSEVEGL